MMARHTSARRNLTTMSATVLLFMFVNAIFVVEAAYDKQCYRKCFASYCRGKLLGVCAGVCARKCKKAADLKTSINDDCVFSCVDSGCTKLTSTTGMKLLLDFDFGFV